MKTTLALFASRAAIVVSLVGAAVLTGWMFDVEALKTIYGPITMKTNPAIAFVFAGLGLWLHLRGWRRVSQLCGGAVALVGGLTLAEHVTGWDLGIDQALFSELPGAAATASPNRMGPNASTSFVLAGVALLLLARQHPRATRAAQVLAFAGMTFALLAVAGYMYGAVELYGLARFTGIALQTAVAFLLLHAGILAASAEYGAVATFADGGAAGTLLRRLTLPILALPLLLGYLVLTARNIGLVDRGLGYALFSTTIIIVLLAILWRTAGAIDTVDGERRKAQADAEQASRLKDQFIAVLSHELRTPLNVMLGRLRLLETETDTETRARAAIIIARNGRVLARLVEDLLDLSRVTAGQFDIAPTRLQLNPLVKASVEGLIPVAHEKGLAVTMEFDPAVGDVYIDPQRIQQVVMNLVSNAVRFTRPDGRITVRTAAGDRTVSVTVQDTGIGFDAEFAHHLFEPFRQADSSTRREHGGLGLGLSIASHLARLHGGSLTAASPGLDGGATFVLTLPVPGTGVEGATTKLAAPAGLHGHPGAVSS